VVAAPSDTVTLAHTLTNEGNGPDSFLLSTASARGWSTRLFLDADANGSVDSGELEVAGVIALAPGASEALVLWIEIPAAAPPATSDTLRVTAQSVFGSGVSASVTDIVSALPGGTARVWMELSGSVDRDTATAGDLLSYTLSYRVTGFGSAEQVTIGTAIPSGTTALANSLDWNPARPGLAAPRLADGLALYDLGTLLAGDSGTVSLKTVADPEPGQTVIRSSGWVSYESGAGADSVVSNEVETWIVSAEPSLEKSLASADTARAGDAVRYTLTARNLSTDIPLRDVILVDTLPPGLAYESSTPAATVEAGASEGGQVLSWQLGTIEPGGDVTVELVQIGVNC